MVVPRLSKDALRCLSETAETERAVGDPNVATAIELLLEWHDGTARRIDELLEANNRYQEEAQAARRELQDLRSSLAFRPTHAHRKRGSSYQVIARDARLQCSGPLVDHEVMVVYAGEDGQLWVRAEYEFMDGRFEALREESSDA